MVNVTRCVFKRSNLYLQGSSVNVCKCVCICVHMCMHVYLYVYRCVCVYVFACAYRYVCRYVYMYLCVDGLIYSINIYNASLGQHKTSYLTRRNSKMSEI